MPKATDEIVKIYLSGVLKNLIPKIQRNYKVAIPIYYVQEKKMQLLLPFPAVTGDTYSAFLVERDDERKRYVLKTILDMIEVYAYESRKPLPAAVLEKDILLTELLKHLSDLQPRGYNFALCGGTALAKGYKVTERMSEDINLKVFVPNNDSAKTALASARAQIRTAIERAGFDGKDCRSYRDNEFFTFRLRYNSCFSSPSESLRPHIQVECINITPVENLQLKKMKSIVGEHFDSGDSFEMPCTTLRETLVEKTVALLRRMQDGEHNNPYLMESAVNRFQNYIPLSTFFHQSTTPGATGPTSIDEVVRWSRTLHGGKRFDLLAYTSPPTSDVCIYAGGLCE